MPGVASAPLNLFEPPLPTQAGAKLTWGGLLGSSHALLIASVLARHAGMVLVIAPDSQGAARLAEELRFFTGGETDVRIFPDWETLPYDIFSPHQDIVSQRLSTLYRLPAQRQGVLIVPLATLLQRLAPRAFLDQHSLLLSVGERLDQASFRQRLEAAGYTCVSQVLEHGEFAVRGSLIDLFPMGSELPYRVDLFDDEIESIRTFEAESQRSIAKVDAIELLPAREFPLDKDGITRFRQGFRSRFEGDPQRSLIYREVSNGNPPAGIEYYLPLFFQTTETLFDYLPATTLVITLEAVDEALTAFQARLLERYEQRRHDIERPLLPPAALFLDNGLFRRMLSGYPQIVLRRQAQDGQTANFGALDPPVLSTPSRADAPGATLQTFVQDYAGRVLVTVESPGRREVLLDTLRTTGLKPQTCVGWQDFLQSDLRLAITLAPLEQGLMLETPALAIVTEAQLYGERAGQARRRTPNRDPETIIRNLTDLAIGAPVVHEEHGVGRYAGLQRLTAAGIEAEYVVLKYAEDGTLYVPVASLHLLGRYTGSAPDSAPLHKLGTEQWARAKQKAAERVRDVAAELLDLYARRQSRPGQICRLNEADYAAFAAGFPFEETPDQQAAIEAVLDDLGSGKPMDRLVCGDVGFGKTEVAMRAAFAAVQDGRQVAMLVPTTLLAQQHYQNFLDRFADWPIRIAVLSRFNTKKQQDAVLPGLQNGTVDIVIGTHKLLQGAVKFKNLGLLIIDEEHRFGVRQKERLKALRAEVDILTLTATPIPRTLNMAMASLRDLSIIATPPAQRLAVKTFVGQWNDVLLQEACQREMKRGGQVYFLHNEVETIERQAKTLQALAPEARIAVAHGQMRERDLEQVMLDFYHRRSHILLCTTIIESGIDVPTANTIIINRADKLGLAQLHQLRGRVGRSHHRAYAYLVVPPREAMTTDAVKRIEAIESLEDLGAGFMLATHDLEIRGAGELLGEEQSGQIQEIGFTLYMELLERAVQSLRDGRTPNLEDKADHGPEISLHSPALIPDDYLPDVHTRLILYKRIASARNAEELRELQVEMIDRFGLLPDPTKTLFSVTSLKLLAQPVGIRKIEIGPQGGRIVFTSEPNIDVGKLLALVQKQHPRYKLDGQDKLRINKNLPDVEGRVKEIEGFLRTVAV
ncbi:MAG: transcription-repair coupling factor [Gammaproteobacteria bacterium]|nr:transcription-repair coupling factor [Gammaproteobacteria bacterium]